MSMKKDNFNIMKNIKIIEDLKAQLLCIIGEFFRLLTKGNNIDKSNIIQDDKKKRVPRLDNSRTVTNSLLKKIILDRSITVNCNFDKMYI